MGDNISRYPNKVTGSASKKRVLLLELHERTSQRGTRYLSGWLGKASVIAFAEETNERGETLWQLYCEEPRPMGGGR